jgi:hypothetical protein
MNVQRMMLLSVLVIGFIVVIEQNALSQTKLGLFFTQEELQIWKQRAVNGPYKSSGDVSQNSPGDWDRIIANKNSFMADPDAQRWAGKIGSCFKNSDTNLQPGFGQGRYIKDAAFYSEVQNDATVRAGVITELLAQAQHAGVQWNNTTVWSGSCTSQMTHSHAPMLYMNTWMAKIIVAYDFVRRHMSSGQQATMDAWLLAYSTRFEPTNHRVYLTQRFPKRGVDDYSVVSSYSPLHLLYFGGPSHGPWHNAWDNTMSTGYLNHGLISIITHNQPLQDWTKRFVREWVRYQMWSEGQLGDLYRWHQDGGSPCKGYWYAGEQMGHILMLAEAFARNGDSSLYEYVTSDGIYGSQGGSKSLKLAAQHFQNMVRGAANGGVNRMATTNASKATDLRYRIDGDCNDYTATGESGSFNWDGIEEVFVAIGNRFWNDNAIKTGYMRQSPYAAYPTSPNGPGGCGSTYEGPWCILPGVLFMWGQMEGKVTPYPSSKELLTPKNLKVVNTVD